MTRPRTTNLTRAITLLYALALLAACGSSPGTDSPDDTVTSTENMETTESTHDHEDEDHDHEDHDHESEVDVDEPIQLDEARRLLTVAAVDEPAIDLIDLGDLSSSTVELESPASLASSLTDDGRFLLTGHDDGVGIVDTGVWSEAHGEHFHHYTLPPELLGVVAGPNPSHLVSHDDLSALYFDGSGEAVLIDEEALTSGEVLEAGRIATGQPHHGFAVPADGHFIVTVPTEDMEELPNMVGVAEGDGTVLEQFDCPLAHGETGLPGGGAVACGDGVVLVSSDDGAWTGTHLPYPEVDDEDPYGYGAARVWALFPSSNGDLVAAPHGAHHLVTIDVEAASLEVHDLGQNVATLGIGVHESGIVVLTVEGDVLIVDPEDGSVVGWVPAITPFTEGNPEAPYRFLVVSGDHAYVSDPVNDQVVEVSLGDSPTVERTIDLAFSPSFIAVANG